MIDTTIRIGTLELKNRLVMPPMHTGLDPEGRATEALARYYGDRARFSGPGLIITEHSCVAESGRASVSQLSLAEDGRIAEHRLLTEAIREGGGRSMAQLNHAGANGVCEPVSAGTLLAPGRLNRHRPRALETAEIAAIEDAFAAAAVRAAEAGYDGVEIHSAHAYLLNQFYSPLTNDRRDGYGGSAEKRLRFLLETVEKVRAAIGASMPLAVRLGGADYLPGGNGEEDAVQAAVRLQEAGVDLLDISGGLCSFIRPGHDEPGWFASMTEKIRRAVSIPVLLTGGVTRLSEAEALLEAGKADLIGVGRALLKDAHWREHA
ncbi:MAG: NADH:flavin oxidoreductase [Oscillospiraceae bacterium]|nr:NADH:flavin oxidoreductase [Oscillospiraceae bacterium]